jgi:hypothetical protein
MSVLRKRGCPVLQSGMPAITRHAGIKRFIKKNITKRETARESGKNSNAVELKKEDKTGLVNRGCLEFDKNVTVRVKTDEIKKNMRKIERKHLSVRTWRARLARKSIRFSKIEQMHKTVTPGHTCLVFWQKIQ